MEYNSDIIPTLQAKNSIAVIKEIQKTAEVLDSMLSDECLSATVERIAEICVKALWSGKKIMFCGNGGSAADSQHLATELVSRLNFDRPGLAAIALTVDTSALTAIGNDYGFDHIFSRQIASIGQTGDVLIAISTSGNSANVLNAISIAKTRGIITIGKTGESGGKMKGKCDILLKIPSQETQRIQEGHIVLGHIYCGMIEERMFRK